MECCYKVFKSAIIKDISIEEDRFGFEPEITAKIAKQNIKIYEVGVLLRKKILRREKNYLERWFKCNQMHYKIWNFQINNGT